jgi:uncharacterized protein (DUF58 family)
MPTRLGWGLVLLLGGIGFAAVNTGNNLLYLMLGIGLAALGVSGLSAGRALAGLEAAVTAPQEILAREPTAFVLTLRNARSRAASPAVEARLQAASENTAVPRLAPGAAAIRFLPARFPRRGVYAAGRLTLGTTDPFGLVRRRRRVVPAGEFLVYPAPGSLERFDEEHPRRGRADTATRRVGEGLELHQIRAYRFDDDSRHIDWRASARLGELMLKEFLEEGVEHLVIVFDPRVPRRMPALGPRFEDTVSLAAALVYRCSERGIPYRFLAPGREFPMVDPPGGHRAVLEYLSTVEPEVDPSAAPLAADLEDVPGVIRFQAIDAAAPGASP